MSEQKQEEPENVDFGVLIEIVNKKITKVRKSVTEEGLEDYDDLIANLYGVISIYDNWLQENDNEMNDLLNKLDKKRKKRSPIILLK